jgi:hypothetical protein
VPQDEWIRVENTHLAIIARELFSAAQNSLFGKADNRPKRQIERYGTNLFKGRIFCDHCGGRMDRKKNHQRYTYRCTTKYSAPEICPGNGIREDALIETVSKVLLEYAKSIHDGLLDSRDAKPIETELAELQIETSYDESTLKTLYESLVMEEITRQEFLDAKTVHNHRKAQRKEWWKQLSLKKMAQAAMVAERQELIDTIKEFQDTLFLTPELIGKLIERIDVHSGDQVYVE